MAARTPRKKKSDASQQTEPTTSAPQIGMEKIRETTVRERVVPVAFEEDEAPEIIVEQSDAESLSAFEAEEEIDFFEEALLATAQAEDGRFYVRVERLPAFVDSYQTGVRAAREYCGFVPASADAEEVYTAIRREHGKGHYRLELRDRSTGRVVRWKALHLAAPAAPLAPVPPAAPASQSATPSSDPMADAARMIEMAKNLAGLNPQPQHQPLSIVEQLKQLKEVERLIAPPAQANPQPAEEQSVQNAIIKLLTSDQDSLAELKQGILSRTIGRDEGPEPDNLWTALGRIGAEIAKNLPLADLAQWYLTKGAQSGQTQMVPPAVAQGTAQPGLAGNPGPSVAHRPEGLQQTRQQIMPAGNEAGPEADLSPTQKLFTFIANACHAQAPLAAVAPEIVGFVGNHPQLTELMDELVNLEPAMLIFRMRAAAPWTGAQLEAPHAKAWIAALQEALTDSEEEGTLATDEATAAAAAR